MNMGLLNLECSTSSRVIYYYGRQSKKQKIKTIKYLILAELQILIPDLRNLKGDGVHLLISLYIIICPKPKGSHY